MIVLIIILMLSLIFNVLFAVLIKKSINRIREYEDLIDDLSEQVNDSMQILKKSMRDIKSAMSTPVQFNDPIVHQIISTIQNSYAAVNMIEFKLGSFFVNDEEESKEFEQLSTNDKKVVVNFLENSNLEENSANNDE